MDNTMPPKMPHFAENVILMDANYVDSVAYDFIVNLQQDLKRPIQDCDLPTLFLCNAIDGGVEEGSKEVMVILVCHKGETQMGHLVPKNLREEVDGFAFSDAKLGEFTMAVVEEEDFTIMAGESLLVQVARVAMSSPDVKRLMLVADWQEHGDRLSDEIEDCHEAHAEAGLPKKYITILSTTPGPELPEECEYEQLGYAILHCLGISEDEL